MKRYLPMVLTQRHFMSVAAVASIALLAGCGGGGGASDDTVTTTTITIPTTNTANTSGTPTAAEISRSNGTAQVGAPTAYSRGSRGQGVKVAVIDTGIDVDHVDLRDRIDNNSIDIVTGSRASVNDQDGHGTHVSGIVAATANGIGTVGVAPSATILAIRADARDRSCSRPLNCGFNDSDNAAAINFAINQGAKVINLSQGKTGGLSSAYQAALNRAAASDVLVVAAAGNDGGNTLINPARTAGTPNARGRVLAVGAVNSSNVRLGFSNRAGNIINAGSMLVAPGLSIRSTNNNGGYTTISGTSQATAFVSGAAAALRSAFPNLNMAQITRILLDTARDLGAAGIDLNFGAGLVDLNAAFQPSGSLSVPLGATLADPSLALAANSVSLPQSFGDAADTAFAGTKILTVDQYNRAYEIVLDQIVRTQKAEFDLGSMLIDQRETERVALTSDDLGAKWLSGSVAHHQDRETVHDRYSLVPRDRARTEADDLDLALNAQLSSSTSVNFNYGTGAMSRGNLALAKTSGLFLDAGSVFDSTGAMHDERGVALGAEHQLNDRIKLGSVFAQSTGDDDMIDGDDATRYQGLYLTHQGEQNATGLTLGILHEQGRVFGSTSEGIFATETNVSQSVTLSHVQGLGQGLDLSAQMTWALSDVDSATGNTQWDDVVSNGWAVALTKTAITNDDDRLGLMVGQPMRSSGNVALDLPRFSSETGDVVREQNNLDLTPTGRQIDVQLAYDRKISPDARWSAYLLARHNAGHSDKNDIDGGVGLRWSQKF